MLILVLFMYDSQALVLCRNVKKQANTCNLVHEFSIFAVEIGKKGKNGMCKMDCHVVKVCQTSVKACYFFVTLHDEMGEERQKNRKRVL